MNALLIALARSLTLNASAFAGITTANFGATVLDGATTCELTAGAFGNQVQPAGSCVNSGLNNFYKRACSRRANSPWLYKPKSMMFENAELKSCGGTS